jgi:hypothetical protein
VAAQSVIVARREAEKTCQNTKSAKNRAFFDDLRRFSADFAPMQPSSRKARAAPEGPDPASPATETGLTFHVKTTTCPKHRDEPQTPETHRVSHETNNERIRRGKNKKSCFFPRAVAFRDCDRCHIWWRDPPRRDHSVWL